MKRDGKQNSPSGVPPQTACLFLADGLCRNAAMAHVGQACPYAPDHTARCSRYKPQARRGAGQTAKPVRLPTLGKTLNGNKEIRKEQD